MKTEIRITHIGGPTALIEVEGWRLLTDPTFDPPGRRYSSAGQQRPRPPAMQGRLHRPPPSNG
jgi:L-ascorbate metabolism protein UlaG (beta-lactamase superfamily)